MNLCDGRTSHDDDIYQEPLVSMMGNDDEYDDPWTAQDPSQPTIPDSKTSLLNTDGR